MKDDSNGIPPELLKVEERLHKNVSATRALIEEHAAAFEQLQSLVDTRNELIEEGKSLCKRHKCSSGLFKTNTATKTIYDPNSFREQFGPKKLADVCTITPKKVDAMLTSGLISKERLELVETTEKPETRVTPKHKPWVVPED